MKILGSTSSYRHSRRAGFTLLEIVIVLGIIAVITGGSIVVVGKKLSEGAKLQRVGSDFNTIISAVSMYQINAGTLPSTSQGLDALIVKPTSTPKPKRWTQAMTAIPLDPWQQPYQYRNPGKIDPSTFEIYSLGKDGQANTEDDLSSQD